MNKENASDCKAIKFGFNLHNIVLPKTTSIKAFTILIDIFGWKLQNIYRISTEVEQQASLLFMAIYFLLRKKLKINLKIICVKLQGNKLKYIYERSILNNNF